MRGCVGAEENLAVTLSKIQAGYLRAWRVFPCAWPGNDDTHACIPAEEMGRGAFSWAGDLEDAPPAPFVCGNSRCVRPVSSQSLQSMRLALFSRCHAACIHARVALA
ncbi:hypothetical protein PR048_007811 [Dryococelus australis]|uniref:Uncharacterized protein n=1 Tax=Dryococelus australis TaxID=614101 RepID=A0ABQ9HW68_9NEOP|nr:hypothetical protein PR048_007811 [Dryococelus australis]